jgi:hypothetical protein
MALLVRVAVTFFGRQFAARARGFAKLAQATPEEFRGANVGPTVRLEASILV